MMELKYMHSLISLPLYTQWVKFCTNLENYNANMCTLLIETIDKAIGKGINNFALDYPVCTEAGNDDYPPPELSEKDRSNNRYSQKSRLLEQSLFHRTISSIPFQPIE